MPTTKTKEKQREKEEEDAQNKGGSHVIIFTLQGKRVNLENLGYFCYFASVLGIYEKIP